jgi:hypothetical protein
LISAQLGALDIESNPSQPGDNHEIWLEMCGFDGCMDLSVVRAMTWLEKRLLHWQ